jgi:hypothetical protein
MRTRRRTLPDFEACSVALFTLLLLGGALHARAQTTPPPPTKPTPTAQMSATAAAPIPANQWTLNQIADAFKRTDTNADGQISRDEARIWNGLTRNFDKVDTNHDGVISNAEFHEALK